MPKVGSTSERGYGTRHQRIRKQYAAQVKAGQAQCWRCGLPIPPDSEWDLGHDDHDRTKYKGPEHIKCNRSTNGRKPAGGPDDSRRW